MTIEQAVNKCIYDHFVETQPKLVEILTIFLREGQTPQMIEARMKGKYTDQTARNIFHLAEYILMNNNLKPIKTDRA